MPSSYYRWCHANLGQATTWDNEDRSLVPWEILDICEELLAKERKKLTRTALGGEILEYTDRSLAGIDQLESARDFLDEVGSYVRTKAMAQVAIRERLGLPSELSKGSDTNWRDLDPKFRGESLFLTLIWGSCLSSLQWKWPENRLIARLSYRKLR